MTTNNETTSMNIDQVVPFKKPRRKKYLNNADLLEQIHRSKMSWCFFKYTDPNVGKRKANNYLQPYANFDYAVVTRKDGQEDLTILEDEARLTIILNEKRRKAQKQGDDTTHYTLDDLVIRINSYDHIPNADSYDDTKTYAKASSQYYRVNFVPFKHYAKVNGKWEAVVISHYDAEGFNPDVGEITPELATMFMKFVEKISYLPNFTGYSYKEDFVGSALMHLCSEGLRFDEARVNASKSKQLNPFAYLQTTIQNNFIRIIKTEKRQQAIRDDMLEHMNLLPSMSRQLANEWKSKGL